MTQEQRQEDLMVGAFIQSLNKPERTRFYLDSGWNMETIKQNALRLIKLEEGEI